MSSVLAMPQCDLQSARGCNTSCSANCATNTVTSTLPSSFPISIPGSGMRNADCGMSSSLSSNSSLSKSLSSHVSSNMSNSSSGSLLTSLPTPLPITLPTSSAPNSIPSNRPTAINIPGSRTNSHLGKLGKSGHNLSSSYTGLHTVSGGKRDRYSKPSLQTLAGLSASDASEMLFSSLLLTRDSPTWRTNQRPVDVRVEAKSFWLRCCANRGVP